MIDRARIMTEVLAYPSTLAVPVVAAVHGPALGAGAALALSADLVVAGEAFSLGYPELANGAYPPLVIPSALAHLSRTLAFELVTTGRRLGADEALAYGVVNHLAEHSADAEALALAADMRDSTPPSSRQPRTCSTGRSRCRPMTHCVRASTI